MSRREPVEAIGAGEPVEEIARVLLLPFFPLLEAALMRGDPYHRAIEDIIATASPGWMRDHGMAVAVRAAEILRRIGPATILTPYGRELFLRSVPPEAIRRAHPPEANDNAPVPRRSWRQRFWAWLWLGIARA